jgi:hypothetical protein
MLHDGSPNKVTFLVIQTTATRLDYNMPIFFSAAVNP